MNSHKDDKQYSMEQPIRYKLKLNKSDTEEKDAESIPLNTIPTSSSSAVLDMGESNGAGESKDCVCDPSCTHFLGSTGNLTGIKEYINQVNDDTVFNSLDNDGRTVLHCISNFRGYADSSIAKNCAYAIIKHMQNRLEDKKKGLDSSVPDYEEQLRNLDETLFQFVNACDKEGLTALYLAAKRENADLCDLLLHCNADWDISTKRRKSPAEKVFKKVPKVIADIFEKSMRDKCKYVDGYRTQVIFDFGPIITYPSPTDRNWSKKGHQSELKGNVKKASERPGLYEELDHLSNICYTPSDQRWDILSKPLLKTFIWCKWQKIKWIIYAARLFQVTWFLLYSIFLLVVYRQDCPFSSSIQFQFQYGFNAEPISTDNKSSSNESDSTLSTLNVEEGITNYCQSDLGEYLVWILLCIIFLDLAFFELPPIRVRSRRYWHPMKTRNFRKYYKRFLLALRILHVGDLMFITIALFTLFPVLKASWRKDQIDVSWNGWYILASIGIGLSWFNILTQIGKIPKLRVYVKMLTKVLQTLSKVLLLYSALIISFAMMFCILLPGVGSYSSPIQAILKMSTFLIGEINYDETFYGEDSKSISVSQGATIVVFVIAIVILNIALLNFVIGLTVSDIQDLKKYTETWENYSILWQVFLFDTFLSRFPLCGQTLMQPLMMFRQEVYVMKPPNTPDLTKKIDLSTLPKLLQKEIHLSVQQVQVQVPTPATTQQDLNLTDVVIHKL